MSHALMNLPLTFLDCVIALIIVVSAGYAAWRGFLWETLTIFAWVSAAFGCLYFGHYLIPTMHGIVNADWLASLLANAAVFLAVFIPLAFISHRVSDSVKQSPIGSLDRLAGVAFGIVRGLVIVGMAYLAFTYFVPIRNQPRWLTQARLLPMVQSTADVLLSVVPDHPHDYIYVPKQEEEVRQAPPAAASHDPVAGLIRRNEAANSVPKSIREPVQHKAAARVTKSYGASDREALDRLVETGGNNR